MPEPVLSPNLAKKKVVRRWFIKHVIPLIQNTRIERNAILRPQWLRYRRMWALRGTEQSYHGRLRLYIPTAHRIVENWQQKLKADLFPQSGKWFSCKPKSTVDDERACEVTAMMDEAIKESMQVKEKFPALLRDLGIIGTTIVDIGWLHEEKMVPTLQQILKDGRKITQEVMKDVVLYLGPTFRVVDPFLFYIYPPTVRTIKEAQLCFEDQMVDEDTLERMARTPIDPDHPELGNQVENWAEVKDYLRQRDTGDKFQAEQIRLAERGLKSRAELGRIDPNRPVDLTTIYWKGSLQDEEDDDGKLIDEPPTWYKVLVTGDDIPVSIRQSPWWDQEPSYLAAKFAELTNEFWGYGLMFLLDHLQYFQNDVWNQTGDGLVFSLNPIVALDATAIQFPDSIKYSPGARWLLRDPTNSVFMMEPPKDTPQVGLAAVQAIASYMDTTANVSPSSPAPSPNGRGGSKAQGSATGMQIVAQDMQLQVKDVEECLEGGILTPMLPKCYSRFQQCLDVDLLLRMKGTRGNVLVERQVSRDDLIGRFTWQWQGSVWTFNQNVKVQHMMNFLQILARVPPDFLQQDNATVDWRYLLTQVWAIGFGDQEAERIIKDIQPTRAVDGDIENELFLLGRGDEVTVSPLDDDMKHAEEHDKLLHRRDLPDEVKGEVMAHVKRHAASYAMKKMQAQQQQEQQQQQQQLQQIAQVAQIVGMLGGGRGGGKGQGGLAALLGGGQGGGDGTQPPTMTDGRTVMPTAPGRLPSTMGEGDVQRRLPRMGG